MSDLTRALINDTVPPGPAWEAEEGKDLDLLREGRADNYEIVQDFLAILSDLRNPNKTTILSDLEREYGIPTNTLLTEATRRTRLAELVYNRSSDGSEDDLQAALRNVGFDVYVYQNDPAVDPAIFLEQQFQMVAAGGNAYAGRSDAFAGKTGGELLVNGDIFTTDREFTSVAGGGLYAGAGHGAGEYDRLLIEKKEYDVPDESALWPFVFFVGGAATLGFVNLVVNGGFETGDFTGWTQNSSTIDNTNPATGTWCSKLVASGAGVAGALLDLTNVDERYIWTLKAKTDITSYVSGTYRIPIIFYDENDIGIGSNSLAIRFAATAGYEQEEKTLGKHGSGADIIFPANTAKITIRQDWIGSATGTAFLDDVELYRSDKQFITAIDNASVVGTREDEFKRIILQYKPLHSWAALVVTFS